MLWKTPVAEGYAGVAIKAGRLYLNDYDIAKKEHVTRCLSMADGKEIWRWSYGVDIRPNHGITRTVPTVGDRFVFVLDPKCQFHAFDIKTGKLVWQKNLVQEYKVTIPAGTPGRTRSSTAIASSWPPAARRWRSRSIRRPAKRSGGRRTRART